MGQKVEVGGTGRDLKGGKALIGGTAYAIKKGRTLKDGTGYDISLTAGETWLINETPSAEGTQSFSANFTSNGQRYTKIELRNLFVQKAIAYVIADESAPAVWISASGWTDQAYRTITFDDPVTGNLLTWLNSNAVRQ